MIEQETSEQVTFELSILITWEWGRMRSLKRAQESFPAHTSLSPAAMHAVSGANVVLIQSCHL